MKAALLLCFLATSWVQSMPADYIGVPDGPAPTQDFPYHRQLDANGDYHTYWLPNKTHVVFEVHARTLGYVGFGLSSNGKMFPADIVIGWVKDGKTYFHDRHSTGHSLPEVDASQDWTLLRGEEYSYGTMLKMVRKLDTCDEEDFQITDDTIRLLYAFHPDDPEDENTIPFHGTKSVGVRSTILLSRIVPPQLPGDVQTRDWLNDNYLVPNKETTYRCKIFDLHDIGKKHHMVKFEPVIQKGHEGIVHHMLVYKCSGIDRKFIGTDYECYLQPNTQLYPCGNVFMGWEYGGGDFYFPETVGMPIGEADDDGLYILETHYNNPEMVPDYVDNSGMRITFTQNLRAHESGLLMTGVTVDPTHIIPPREQNFMTTGFCHRDCLNTGLSEYPEGVNVFAVWQHAHLIAKSVKTRHFREGVELEPLAHEEHFDFNYQDYRYMTKHTTLKMGDELVVECVYETMAKSKVTIGGPATGDEMCLSFIYYWPRMSVDYCRSIPLYNGNNTSGEYVKELTRDYNYNDDDNRRKFHASLVDSTYNATCHGERRTPQIFYAEKTIPVTNQTYTRPRPQCPNL
ncbi:DBH-like monooxygenase protein 1 homolog [Dreissena polymorpha]|uniref:DOMON domain-containing protein n=1 Tax=Dreissena polymorpha TaxID=45954 RepID=A0A9D4LUC7_DREPO|nr:DBH-like monooxygenase protein 1 homolog [Dreissena polymorpha]KAH3863952.1 hypothetical protein DPMN_026960 [Dreissena polymorpha]